MKGPQEGKKYMSKEKTSRMEGKMESKMEEIQQTAQGSQMSVLQREREEKKKQ